MRDLLSLTDLTLLRINPYNYLGAQAVASEKKKKKKKTTTKKIEQGFFLSLSRIRTIHSFFLFSSANKLFRQQVTSGLIDACSRV